MYRHGCQRVTGNFATVFYSFVEFHHTRAMDIVYSEELCPVTTDEISTRGLFLDDERTGGPNRAREYCARVRYFELLRDVLPKSNIMYMGGWELGC